MEKSLTATGNSVLQRCERLIPLLREEEVDALLISHPIHVTYLTGFRGDSSYLILGRERTLLVSDARYTEQIAAECPGLETYIRPPSQNIYQATAQTLNQLGFRSVGFESNHLTVAEWEILRELTKTMAWKGGRDRVEQLRIIKDASEIVQIREAIDFAERAYLAFRALVRAEDREKDVADALEMYIRRLGGQCTSFPPIVAVDERAALPHASPGDRVLGEGALVLVDWGASGPLYKSDLTRVLAIRTISPKLEEVYAVVFRAQEKALQTIRPGIQAQSVDAEARAVIAQAGFGEFFGHGLGHGFGLQIHEAPFVRPRSEIILQPGMVITVEPGIYLPGWGGVRLEDDVLVTENGCEMLTRVTRELAILDI